MNESEGSRTNRSRLLLEALPQSVSRALPSARATSDLCSNAVARAVQFRNPRIVTEWLDYETTRAPEDVLLSVLESSVRLETRDSGNARVVSLAARIVAEAREYLSRSQRNVAVEHRPSDEDAAVDVLVGAIAIFDADLRRHSLDVAGTAMRIASVMNCSDDELQLVWNASRAHEVGRLRLDRGHLSSSRTFNAEERELVRAGLGDVRSLRDIPACGKVADVIEEMYLATPLVSSRAASIVKVADGFHSLCEARSYRPALRPDEAIAQICRERGSTYDGLVVDSFALILGFKRPYARSA